MNKGDLVESISEKAGLSKKDTEKALKALVDTVEDAVASGDKVQLIGFGTFEARERQARMGRNPKNPNEKIAIAARKSPAFKAGKEFKDKVNA
jgi:DNA-binding protein HU-beta